MREDLIGVRFSLSSLHLICPGKGTRAAEFKGNLRGGQGQQRCARKRFRGKRHQVW